MYISLQLSEETQIYDSFNNWRQIFMKQFCK